MCDCCPSGVWSAQCGARRAFGAAIIASLASCALAGGRKGRCLTVFLTLTALESWCLPACVAAGRAAQPQRASSAFPCAQL